MIRRDKVACNLVSAWATCSCPTRSANCCGRYRRATTVYGADGSAFFAADGSSGLLPFDFASYASNVRQFVNELAKGKDMSKLDLTAVRTEIDNFEAAGNSSRQTTEKTLR